MFSLRFVSLAVLVLAFATLGHAEQIDEQEFNQRYLAHLFDGLIDPAAANARVLSVVVELARYSKHVFPVFPAEQWTLGQATPTGIYLDVSVAADPSVEVTRFWLAHEWGHMMHGDPLSQFTRVGQYRMLMGGTAVEDAADTYAATFMRYQHHKIGPVIDFLCSLPGGGGTDSHRPGPQRAMHVARIFGSPDEEIGVPCAQDNTTDANDAAEATQDTDAVQQCNKTYDTCMGKIISVNQCVANNVNACTRTCTAGPLYCDCSPQRFRHGCSEVINDEPKECRDKRDRCLNDAAKSPDNP